MPHQPDGIGTFSFVPELAQGVDGGQFPASWFPFANLLELEHALENEAANCGLPWALFQHLVNEKILDKPMASHDTHIALLITATRQQGEAQQPALNGGPGAAGIRCRGTHFGMHGTG